jgi:hypothetical protein
MLTVESPGKGQEGGIAMLRYGQVIDINIHANEHWVTIWNPKNDERWSGCDSTAKLKIKDYVSFTANHDTFLTDLRKVDVSALPQDVIQYIHL